MVSGSDPYIDWSTTLNDASDNKFLTTCINNGIPLRTCCAVDSAALSFLTSVRQRTEEAKACRGSVPNIPSVGLHLSAQVTLMQLQNNKHSTGNGSAALAVLREFSQLSDKWSATASNTEHSAFFYHTICADGSNPESHKFLKAKTNQSTEPRAQVQSALIDTGADISLFKRQVEASMSNKQQSTMRIQVADSNYLQGHTDDKLHMCLLNAQQGEKQGMILSHQVTTADNLSHELLSIDDMYVKGGFSILLRNPNFESDTPEIFKPLVN